MIYPEALSVGCPIVALAGNAVADDVAEAGTGRVFSGWQGLHEALADVNRMSTDLTETCLSEFEDRYTKGTWLRSMLQAYERAAQDPR